MRGRPARSRVGLAVIAAGLGLAPAGGAAEPLVLEVPAAIAGAPVHAVLPPDAIRAIDAPAFRRGPGAARQMTADEVVLGLRIGGDARAYPLGYLSAHEIVNDLVGGRPVAVTW